MSLYTEKLHLANGFGCETKEYLVSRYLMAVTKEKYLRLQQGTLAKGTGACHCSTLTKNILWIYSLLIKKRRQGGAITEAVTQLRTCYLGSI